MLFVRGILEQFPASVESLGLRPLSYSKIFVIFFFSILRIFGKSPHFFRQLYPGASWCNLK